jgi:pyruvate formate lyase activating enzyme
LASAYEVAKRAGVDFVYLGNVFAGDKDDTFCPKCGTKVVDREGFWVRSTNLRGSRCAKCGADLYMVT